MAELNILDLDDLCLHSTMEYLGVNDLFHLSHTCTRFPDLAKECARNLCKNINCCVLMGISRMYYRRQIILGSKYCKQLTIYLSEFPIGDTSMLFDYVGKMDSLKNLMVMGCSHCVLMQNYFFSALKHLESLRRLYVYDSCARWLDNLCRLRNLEEVQLGFDVEVSDLVKLCQSNTNLRNLSIFRSCKGNLADLAPHCQNLKELFFYTNGGLYCTQPAHFPKLKDLSMEIFRVGNTEVGELASSFSSDDSLASVIHFDQLRATNFEEIAKIPSLKGINVHCNRDTLNCLATVPLLEIITIRNYEAAFLPSLLNICRACLQLKQLFLFGPFQVSYGFCANILEVLKSVRNPTEQKPLEVQLFCRMSMAVEDLQEFTNEYMELTHF
ncbi:uncharacterized protein LOC115632112 [Scaptodrosophila lebanonensis]|uniref:Uncharacterized protein LOC115632112 n=1 Tax=Drosophila lebanonensis TaxID=7225 RepID=A0A6J2UAC7_DROLE|nr:uncharacterized protein LOC115632112 [Scaptodrosophila lebanonensis]